MSMSWYTAVQAPFGTLYIIAENDRIVQIRPEAPSCVLALKRDTMPLLQQSAEEIRAYLEGRTRRLSTPLPAAMPPFEKAVYSRIMQIPYAETRSAERIAADCGYPHAVHAVRMLCLSNPLWIAIPCHRVRDSDRPTDHTLPLCGEDALLQMEKRYADTLTNPYKEGKL